MTDARTLTTFLGGRWHGRYGAAPCPCCQAARRKEQNALTLTDGRTGLLLHCKRAGCAFHDILGAAGISPTPFIAPDLTAPARYDAERKAEARRRAWQATSLWKEAQPIGGTVAEAYLRGRCITCILPETLRFHPDCWHGATATRHPALVALVKGGDGCAVHRTYLRADGTGKAALDPPKAMLGAVAGGGVRVAEGQGALVVAEGIETALSLASGLLRAPATVWAALSTSGIRGLRLPPDPHRLTIAADGDDAGRAAAQALASRAHGIGWTVSLLPAPKGRDWNDILTLKGEVA